MTPTLDTIASAPESVRGLSRELLFSLSLKAQAVQMVLALAMIEASGERATQDTDRLLKASDVAARLGKSRKWVYAHASTLPFAVLMDGRKHPRFSEHGLTRYIATRQRSAGSAMG